MIKMLNFLQMIKISKRIYKKNKDENFHRFALSATRGELLERERNERKKRKTEKERKKLKKERETKKSGTKKSDS